MIHKVRYYQRKILSSRQWLRNKSASLAMIHHNLAMKILKGIIFFKNPFKRPEKPPKYFCELRHGIFPEASFSPAIYLI
jgi:hypothetical protein